MVYTIKGQEYIRVLVAGGVARVDGGDPAQAMLINPAPD